MRIDRDTWGVYLASVTSLRGTCIRRRVGCVLLDEHGHVLATGYNGVPSGFKHCNETDHNGETPHACEGAHSKSGTNLDSCNAIHAEQNALLQCEDVRKIHTAYITVSPCITCVKLLLNTGCRRIVFVRKYPHTEALTLWETAGREWVHISPKPLACLDM